MTVYIVVRTQHNYASYCPDEHTTVWAGIDKAAALAYCAEQSKDNRSYSFEVEEFVDGLPTYNYIY